MGEYRGMFSQCIHDPAVLEDGRPQCLDTERQHCIMGGTFLLKETPGLCVEPVFCMV